MDLIALLFNDVVLENSSEKITTILVIALVTMSSLLVLALFKAHKLRKKIKQLENN